MGATVQFDGRHGRVVTTRRAIIQAIRECTRYIVKESARNPDTRPAWAAEALARTIAHRSVLQASLESPRA